MIEVVLVLAIAGLIFLMVFIALPQIQRSQRDAERKDEIMLFIEAVKKFQTNNRGVLPDEVVAGLSLEDPYVVPGRPSDSERNTVLKDRDSSWNAFYYDYLDEQFADPDGDNYQIEPVTCDGSGATLKQGERCNYDDPDMDYTLHVFTQAECVEDHAVKSSNPRDFAVVYRTESSGVFCSNS